jgi:hypothetical protein
VGQMLQHQPIDSISQGADGGCLQFHITARKGIRDRLGAARCRPPCKEPNDPCAKM